VHAQATLPDSKAPTNSRQKPDESSETDRNSHADDQTGSVSIRGAPTSNEWPDQRFLLDVLRWMLTNERG
jgi:hypothetical protein